jgi:hypothetical protein
LDQPLHHPCWWSGDPRSPPTLYWIWTCFLLTAPGIRAL